MTERRRLPDTRPSVTHRVRIESQQGPVTLYLTAGLDEDGQPLEFFIRVGKAGSTMNGLLDTVGVLTSYLLQYGMPLDELCDRMMQTSFEPAGETTNEEIEVCSSLIDYAFTWLKSQSSRSTSLLRPD